MRWNEFVSKLKTAQDQGKAGKVRVPALAVLIFSGAFDSMCDSQPTVSDYHRMFEEVKKSKKSKAKLPPAAKDDIIGLENVKSVTQLTAWRNQKSPIVKTISLEEEIDAPLKHRGFTRINNPSKIFTFIRGEGGGKKIIVATPYWSELFKENRLGIFDRQYGLLVYGVVSDVKLLKFGADKSRERMTFRVFTGQEMTDEIVIWPKDDGKVAESYKHDVKNGVIAAFHVRPSLYNGKPTGTVNGMERFVI